MLLIHFRKERGFHKVMLMLIISCFCIVSKRAPQEEEGLDRVHEGHGGAKDGDNDETGAETSTERDKLGPDGDWVGL